MLKKVDRRKTRQNKLRAKTKKGLIGNLCIEHLNDDPNFFESIEWIWISILNSISSQIVLAFIIF